MAIAWNRDGILCTCLPEENECKLRKTLFKKTAENANEQNPPASISSVIRSIQKHLTGRNQMFSLSLLNLTQIPAFHKEVYKKAVALKPGEILSYGELATRAGSPKAARAVGQAMAKNPFPIIVPCHRVFAAGNKPGGFSAFGGIITKHKILSLEQGAAP